MDKDWNLICKNCRFRSEFFPPFTLKCLIIISTSSYSNHHFQTNPSGTCSFHSFRKCFEKNVMTSLVVLVVKTLSSQHRGHGFNPWSGNSMACHTPWPKKKKNSTENVNLGDIKDLMVRKHILLPPLAQLACSPKWWLRAQIPELKHWDSNPGTTTY